MMKIDLSKGRDEQKYFRKIVGARLGEKIWEEITREEYEEMVNEQHKSV